MEIQLNTDNWFQIIYKYLLENIILSGIVIYFIISIGIKMFFSIDVCLPCLWNTLFHFHCPGCGLTTAFIEILKLNFSDAFHINPLIFIVLPILFYCFIQDFNRFLSKNIINH
jgi:hypothetical protein